MSDDAVLLGPTKEDHIWTYAIFGFGGLLLFGLSPWLAGVLGDVPFIPFRSVLRWIGELSATWIILLRPALGLVVGLAIAALIIADEYHLEVGAESLVIAHGSDRRTVCREQVLGVHAEGKHVQIDGVGGRTILNKKIDAPRDAVREAFTVHGYPWESQ